MINPKVAKQRVIFLDLTKTIAIYLVCFYHFDNSNMDFISSPQFSTFLNYYIKGIASAGVPLFLMINGALLLNNHYHLKKHIWKTINICILTTLWGALTLLALIPIFDDKYTLREFITALWYLKPERIGYLWFLQTIVCIYVFFPLIKNCFDNDKKIIYYFVIITFIFTFGNVFINNLVFIAEWIKKENYLPSDFNFFNGFNVFRGYYAYSLVYFILGGLLFPIITSKRIKIPKIFLVTGLLLGLLLLCLFGIIKSYSERILHDSVWNGYDTIMTLVITISTFIITAEFKLSKNLTFIISTIGSNTLGIYFLHYIVGLYINYYFKSLPYYHNILFNLMYSALIMFLSILLVLIIKKIPILKLTLKI